MKNRVQEAIMAAISEFMAEGNQSRTGYAVLQHLESALLFWDYTKALGIATEVEGDELADAMEEAARRVHGENAP